MGNRERLVILCDAEDAFHRCLRGCSLPTAHCPLPTAHDFRPANQYVRKHPFPFTSTIPLLSTSVTLKVHVLE
jgi:hypothetical protein